MINPPKVKTKYVEIPGSDNIIDMTDSLKGYPIFENREGSIEFIVENGHKEWHELYAEIVEFLHGRCMKLVLEDDPAHYYEGRFSVNEWRSDVHWSLITIDYFIKPYKLSVVTSTEDWLWDPFNFDIGIIQQSYFKEISVNSDSFITYDYGINGLIGSKPVCPLLTVFAYDENYVTIRLYNMELGIDVTKDFGRCRVVVPEFIFSNISSENSILVSLKGQGTVSFDFRSGGL